MQRPQTPQDYDLLFERYIFIQRISMGSECDPITFGQFCECPDKLEAIRLSRLRDWVMNPRFLTMLQADVILN